MSKSPLLSKTIWFNVLSLLAVAVAAVSEHAIVTENALLVGGFAVATALVNVGLRLVTKTAIK